MIIKKHNHRYILALALPLLGLAGAKAHATSVNTVEHIDLTRTYTCPLPLMGDEIVNTRAWSEGPDSIYSGDPFRFDAFVEMEFSDYARWGFKLVNADSLQADGQLETNLETEQRSLSVFIDLAFPSTEIPDETGAFTITGSGTSPVFNFMETYGAIRITAGDIQLSVTTRTAGGSLADEPLGEFISNCTQDDLQTQPLSVSPTQVDFGVVTSGTQETRQVTVTNTSGQQYRNIDNIRLTGEHIDAFTQTNNCTTLAPSTSCQVMVTYASSGPGSHNVDLVIESAGETRTVDITGESSVTPPVELTVSPGALNFGVVAQGETVQRVVTLSNEGASEAAIEMIDIVDNDALEFTLQDQASALVLSPGETVQFLVTLTKLTDQDSSATLRIQPSGSDTPPILIPLSAELGVVCPDPSSKDLKGYTDITGTNTRVLLEGTLDAGGCAPTPDVSLSLENISVEVPASGFFGFLLDTRVQMVLTEKESLARLQDGTSPYIKTTQELTAPAVTVSLFGVQIKIGGGANCRAVEPVVMDLKFTPGNSIELDGSYTISEFENCGMATKLLNRHLSGEGNTIHLSSDSFSTGD